MLVLAMSAKGHEYMYKASTAHKVSKRSAETIRDIANDCKYLFDRYPDCVWHLHDVDQYDMAYDYAQFQSFTIRNGLVKSRTMSSARW